MIECPIKFITPSMQLISKDMFWKYFWDKTNNPMQWDTFNKYVGNNADEAFHMLSHNGMKGVMEVLIKNWCIDYFGEEFKLPKNKNEKGFDIQSISDSYRIEVKTVWTSTNPKYNSNIVSFGNLVSKQNNCTHILFYNGFNDANAFYLFAHDDVYTNLKYTGTHDKPQIRYSPIFNTRRRPESRCYTNSIEFMKRRIQL
jgi:hypothetical protein